MAVTGIGGVFFRADDPGALAKLYEQHLGPTTGPLLWMREEGPTVFALPTVSRPIGIREEMAKVGGLQPPQARKVTPCRMQRRIAA